VTSAPGGARSLVALYAALLPFLPIVHLPGGSPLRLAAGDAIAPVVLLAGLLWPRRRLEPGLTILAVAVPVLALLLTLVAALGRDVTGYTISKTVGLFYLAALYLAVFRLVRPGEEQGVLRGLALGALVSGGLGLVAYAADLAGVPNSMVEHGRLCGTMPGDPNVYGSLLAVAIPIVAVDERRSPVLRALAIVALLAAILATGSRSATVAAMVAVAVALWLWSRDRWVTAACGAYALMAGALILIPVALLNDAAGGALAWAEENAARDFTVRSRLDLYVRAIDLFTRHPLLGLGIGGFHDLNEWTIGAHRGAHYAVHNVYLWALVDLGIVGGLLVVALFWGSIARAAWVARGAERSRSAVAVAAALAGLAAFNLFIDGFYQRPLWLLMALAAAMTPAPTRGEAGG